MAARIMVTRKDIFALLFGVAAAFIMFEIISSLSLAGFTRERFDARYTFADGILSLECMEQQNCYHSLIPRSHGSTIEKKQGKIRIAFIGDSFTYGVGVDAEQSYPSQLQKMLGSGYEVINFGFPELTTLDTLWLAENVVKEYDPDLVIYGFYFNDICFYDHNLDFGYCSIFPMSKSEIFLARLIRPKEMCPQKFSLDDYVDHISAECSSYAALEMDRIFDGRFYMFTIPPDPNARMRDCSRLDNEVMESYGRKGIKVLDDVEEIFYATKNHEDYIIDNMHLTAEGNYLLAEILYPRILNITV